MKGNRGKRTWVALVSLALGATAVADPDDFVVDAQPVFQGLGMSPDPIPVAIRVENRGPDARGQIVISLGDRVTRYPVDLPQGSKKRVMTYPADSMYGGGQIEFHLETDQGRLQIPFVNRSGYGYNTNVFAFIGDNPGEMGFFRQQTTSKAPGPGQPEVEQYLDVYCKPEDAPDRPVGYSAITSVILGPGSERLSDDVVKALKLYALSGGTLVFVGGASPAVLTDPRWKEALPAANFRTRTIQPGDGLISLGGSVQPDSYTVSVGTVKPATRVWKDNGTAVVVDRTWGLGKVVLMTFNPFEEPFIRWKGRKKLFVNTTRPMDRNRTVSFLRQFQGSDSGYDSYTGRPVTTYPNINRDPFDVELPSTNKVFWILVSYFIVVVPLNFIVLRKFKRGELAWITAPIISLVFAGIFLVQASNLYSAKLSTATNGILLVQDGMPTSVFVGHTQMFFPNGGAYDLKLDAVDQLVSDREYRPWEQSSRTQIDPVDVGAILVPDLRAANLAFEEIGYRQTFEKKRPISVRWLGEGQLRLTNTSGGQMRDVDVSANGVTKRIEPLAAGASRDIDVTKMRVTREDRNAGDLRSFAAITLRNPTLIVSGVIEGMRPGPQIGTEVLGRSRIQVACFFDNPAGRTTR